MRRLTQLLTVAVLAGLVVPAVPAAATVVPGVPSAETEIRNVLGRWDRARAQHDATVLADVMTEDFTGVAANGARLTRAAILAGAPERGARLITRDDLTIDVQGERATARATVTKIGTAAGPERGETIQEVATLLRRGDAWRILSIQARPSPR